MRLPREVAAQRCPQSKVTKYCTCDESDPATSPNTVHYLANTVQGRYQKCDSKFDTKRMKLPLQRADDPRRFADHSLQSASRCSTDITFTALGARFAWDDILVSLLCVNYFLKMHFVREEMKTMQFCKT